jgi:hypothetical protein
MVLHGLLQGWLSLFHGTHVHIYIFFLLRMTDAMTSQNIDLSSWNSLYIEGYILT